jgi:hypothetical protein
MYGLPTYLPTFLCEIKIMKNSYGGLHKGYLRSYKKISYIRGIPNGYLGGLFK